MSRLGALGIAQGVERDRLAVGVWPKSAWVMVPVGLFMVEQPVKQAAAMPTDVNVISWIMLFIVVVVLFYFWP